MALFGDLKHIPFTELIPPLVKRTGWLTVRTPGAVIRLEINQGQLLRAFRDHQSLNLGSAKTLLRELVQTLEAPFEFTGAMVETPKDSLNFFLPDVMLDLQRPRPQVETPVPAQETKPKPEVPEPPRAAEVPAPGQPQVQNYIDPATRFHKTDEARSIPGPLGLFLFKITHLLNRENGASSQEIAQIARIPLQEVVQQMYALRQMGFISAVDAFSVQRKAAQRAERKERLPGAPDPFIPPRSMSNHTPTLAQRLLQALRAVWLPR